MLVSCDGLLLGDAVSCCAKAIEPIARVRASKPTDTFFISFSLSSFFLMSLARFLPIPLVRSWTANGFRGFGCVLLVSAKEAEVALIVGRFGIEAQNCVTLLVASHHKLRCPQECPLNLRIREGADCLPCRLRIPCGSGSRRFERSIALQYVHDLAMGHAIKGPVAQNRFNLGSFL